MIVLPHLTEVIEYPHNTTTLIKKGKNVPNEPFPKLPTEEDERFTRPALRPLNPPTKAPDMKPDEPPGSQKARATITLDPTTKPEPPHPDEPFENPDPHNPTTFRADPPTIKEPEPTQAIKAKEYERPTAHNAPKENETVPKKARHTTIVTNTITIDERGGRSN